MSTIPIPAEYLGYDYGFSGEDAPREPAVVQSPAIDPSVAAQLLEIQKKLDSITPTAGAIGTEAELKEDIRKLEAIIIPLLNNLLKTADKEYIYWPNRKVVIEQQIQRVLEITRA